MRLQASLIALIVAGIAVAPTAASPTREARATVVEAVAAEVASSYVSPDQGRAAARLVRTRLRQGAYDRHSDEKAFVEALTADLQSVTHDKHLVVRWSAAGYPKASNAAPDMAASAAERLANERANYGMPRVEILDGNIGYLKIDQLHAPQEGGATLVAAMTFLARTDALIYDLRDNKGGDSAMVALALSYLVKPGTKLVSFRSRDGQIAQSWSAPYAPGGVWSTAKPVYVLISNSTFSAAEEFAFDLQQLKRATIVGATSRGGANPGIVRRLGDHYRMFVPNEAAIGPITGTNWEGVGVKPDVPVDAAEALTTAHRLALEGSRRSGSDW